jgi:redox-sensitive bicupin YhaK (pirin superfamily)
MPPPIVTVRRAADRGRSDLGWLDSRHTFSFADYYDPRHLGFRALRVINDDRVAEGGGFPSHPHRDMEIISYVLDGQLEHKDSMGNGSVVRPGDVQRMTAGTGVVHSEYNHSHSEPVRFLQVWILPARKGLEPSYEQRSFSEQERRNHLRIVASPDGRHGSVVVHQNLFLYTTLLGPGDEVRHALAPNRHAWVQVARGAVEVAGTELFEGDGLAASNLVTLDIRGTKNAEVLLFDLD